MKEALTFLDDLTKVFEYKFLYNNAEWDGCNSPDVLTVFHNNKINDWVYFDELDNIQQFQFNLIKCHSAHGFGGTTFSLDYYLDDKYTCGHPYIVAPTKEMLKQRKIDKLNSEIEWIDDLQQKRHKLCDEIERIEKM